VVTSDAQVAATAWRAGARSFTQRTSDSDLNRDLIRYRDSCAGDFPVAVLLGDLPALTTLELTMALSECFGYLSAFAPDHRGQGTTMLYSRQGRTLGPAFGSGSALAHRAGGAHRLRHVGFGLSHDVDTLTDLSRTSSVRVGANTTATLLAYPDLLSGDRRTKKGDLHHARLDIRQ
jgi:2-phospho-L-lactate guanylyltransferase